MWLIKRLWVDPMENRDAYGFDPIGVVTSADEAERICNLEVIQRSQYPWPLNYANEFPGETVPRFVATKIVTLDGCALQQLKEIKKEIL